MDGQPFIINFFLIFACQKKHGELQQVLYCTCKSPGHKLDVIGAQKVALKGPVTCQKEGGGGTAFFFCISSGYVNLSGVGRPSLHEICFQLGLLCHIFFFGKTILRPFLSISRKCELKGGGEKEQRRVKKSSK